jgi:hypothetical protein
MIVVTSGGLRSPAELSALLEEAGFRLVEVRELPRRRQLIVAEPR